MPLYHLRRSVQLVPKFGEKADPTLTPQMSFNASRDFFLNQYFDKEDFFFWCSGGHFDCWGLHPAWAGEGTLGGNT